MKSIYKIGHVYTIDGKKHKAIEILNVRNAKGRSQRVTFQNIKTGHLYEKAQKYRK